ncbi:ankyrin repeat [Fusarium longipes]|uniref:Ankyrin repeat n=1 Tax=Fusarium longipes TaxID=694270 RepID=A0A395T5X2_9HYPO|nr:ankyrin repeat [Fusarium longipes]
MRLHNAVISNDEKAVENILKEDPDLDVNLRDEQGRTALWLAANAGYERIVRILCEKDGIEDDIDLNPKIAEGFTPLMMAVLQGNEDIVKMLLERDGTDLCLDQIPTPLSLALKPGYTAIGWRLLSAEFAQALELSDQTQGSAIGRTPLSWAVENDNRDAVKLLLEMVGTDPNLRDHNGRTPLSRAAEHGNVAAMLLLLQRSDIDVNQDDRDGRTPLYHAAENRQTSIVLLFAGKDNATLPLLVREGEDILIKFILRCNYDVNAPNGRGQTALHTAILSYRPRIAEILISLDANINAEDHEAASVPSTRLDDMETDLDMVYTDCVISWSMIDDGLDFFQQFISCLAEKWLTLIDEGRGRLNYQRSIRDDSKLGARLGERANKMDVFVTYVRRLWILRLFLGGQVESARRFVRDYNTRYGFIEDRETFEAINRFSNVDLVLASMEQTVRDALQLEYAWVSTNEAYKSTSLCKSMKRLSWITFIFLPATFASSLFGMNVNILESNPDWRWMALLQILQD